MKDGTLRQWLAGGEQRSSDELSMVTPDQMERIVFDAAEDKNPGMAIRSLEVGMRVGGVGLLEVVDRAVYHEAPDVRMAAADALGVLTSVGDDAKDVRAFALERLRTLGRDPDVTVAIIADDYRNMAA